MGGLYAGLFQELSNECAAFGAVIVEGFVGPFPGDEDAAPGDAKVFDFVGVAFASSGCHGVPGAFRLDSVEQPYRTPWRAWGEL
jgi:hypothetical protein